MKKLRDCRKMAGLTQAALGRRCKVPRSRIAYLELGLSVPAPDEVQRIREAILRASRENQSRIARLLDVAA
jgi:transcriptional regulator with XRE-family HTH domain